MGQVFQRRISHLTIGTPKPPIFLRDFSDFSNFTDFAFYGEFAQENRPVGRTYIET